MANFHSKLVLPFTTSFISFLCIKYSGMIKIATVSGKCTVSMIFASLTTLKHVYGFLANTSAIVSFPSGRHRYYFGRLNIQTNSASSAEPGNSTAYNWCLLRNIRDRIIPFAPNSFFDDRRFNKAVITPEPSEKFELRSGVHFGGEISERFLEFRAFVGFLPSAPSGLFEIETSTF